MNDLLEYTKGYFGDAEVVLRETKIDDGARQFSLGIAIENVGEIVIHRRHDGKRNWQEPEIAILPINMLFTWRRFNLSSIGTLVFYLTRLEKIVAYWNKLIDQGRWDKIA